MESPTYGTPNLWDIFRSFFVQKVSNKLANDCIIHSILQIQSCANLWDTQLMGPFSIKSIAQIGPISWHMTVFLLNMYHTV